jgi:predicted methyltransferase
MKVKGEAEHALAIHTISHPTVSGNTISKIFDIERALEARSEEAAKRSDERCKCCHGKGVELEWRIRDWRYRVPQAELQYPEQTTDQEG